MESKAELKTNETQQSTPLNIELVIEASALFPLPNTDKNVDEHTALEDGLLSCPIGSTKKECEFGADLLSQVTWRPKLAFPKGADRNYKVQIDQVYQENTPPQFFWQNPIKGINGVASGVVLNDPNLLGKTDNYNIQFTIFNPSGQQNSFTLDPKLKVNPK